FQGTVEINQTKPKVNINTSELSVDLVNKIHHSNQPVIVVTENMKITGEDMNIDQESGTIYFGGYANLVIMENQQPKHVSKQE
ncbi:MAG: LPS export ABC transporter periplasmic protein LptC, partial [Alphaproteobacteria bacterium]